MLARYFYYIPPKESKKHWDGNICNVWISPGHYGKTTKSLQESEKLLLDKLEDIPCQYFNLSEKTDANIELGASRWDKGVLRVHLQFEIINPENNKELIQKLESHGFFLVYDNFACY